MSYSFFSFVISVRLYIILPSFFDYIFLRDEIEMYSEKKKKKKKIIIIIIIINKERI